MHGNGSAYATQSLIGYGNMPMDTPTQVARQPLITMQLESLMKAAEALHDHLTALENRLQPIVMPEPPQGNGASEKRPEQPVALAGALERIAERVDYAYRRVASLTQRIEL